MPIIFSPEELLQTQFSHTNRMVGSAVKYLWNGLNIFFLSQKSSSSDPVLLIVDGHTSHTRNLHLIVKARECHVTIMCLPPHSIHKLQSLDKTFMAPTEHYYGKEIRRWQLQNKCAVLH